MIISKVFARLAVAALVIVLLLYVSYRLLLHLLDLDESCRDVLIQRELSADWTWQADVYEATCPVGNFSTDVLDRVRITATDDPKRAADILGVDTGGNDDERIRIHWVGSRILEIDIPYITYLKILALQFEGVHVRLHAEGPDDPATKAARFDWERKHGLPIF